ETLSLKYAAPAGPYKYVPDSSQHLLDLLQSGNSHNDLLEGNQANRVQTSDVANIHVGNVAGSQVQVLLDGIGQNQGVCYADVVQLGSESLGLGSVDNHVINDNQTLLANQLGKNGAHCCAVHFAVYLLLEATRLGCKGN